MCLFEVVVVVLDKCTAMHIFILGRQGERVGSCVFVYLYLCICIFVFVYMCICVFVNVYLCICICAFV